MVERLRRSENASGGTPARRLCSFSSIFLCRTVNSFGDGGTSKMKIGQIWEEKSRVLGGNRPICLRMSIPVGVQSAINDRGRCTLSNMRYDPLRPNILDS